jgi:biopolymer transport protein ExbB
MVLTLESLALFGRSLIVVGLLSLNIVTSHAQTPAIAAPAVSTAENAASTMGNGAPAVQAIASTPATANGVPASDSGANPYGVGALWAQGDFVARGTLLILILMSMATWYVLITKLLEQAKIIKQARAIGDEFWNGTVTAKVAELDAESPFRYIGDKAAQGAAKFASVSANIDLQTWLATLLQRAASKVQSKLQIGLAVLATVGSTAPFVGLFGTVWGIYHALVSIGISGQASIDKVAGPVGEALIMTAIGLAVAVPAVLGYNWLVRRNKQIMESVTSFSGDLHAALLAEVKR